MNGEGLELNKLRWSKNSTNSTLRQSLDAKHDLCSLFSILSYKALRVNREDYDIQQSSNETT